MEEENISKFCNESTSFSPPEICSKSKKLKLKVSFGIVYGVGVAMGLVIGSGIFISPQVIMEKAGSPGLTLIVWFTAGIFALMGSLVFSEIGLNIPKSGGMYSYLCEIYNQYFGVVFIWWYLLLLRPGNNALKLLIFGRYILKPIYGDCEIPQLAILTVSTIIALLISVLNCIKVKVAARGQAILTSFAFLTLIIIICFGAYYIVTVEKIENFHEPFKDSCKDPVCLVFAFYGASYSYHGWAALFFIVEEVHDPARTLPTVTILTSILSTILYTLINFTYLAVLDKSEMISSQAIAITFILKFSTFGGWIMSILIGITSCSSYFSGQLIGSRTVFVGARNGHLPVCLSFINIKYISPIVSVIVLNLTTVIYAWIFELHYLMNNIAFSSLLFELLQTLGYVWNRIKKKYKFENDSKTFKIPLAIHVIYIILLVIVTSIPLLTNFVASAVFSLTIIVMSTIYYQICVNGRLSFKWSKFVTDKIYYFIQKLLYCAPEGKDR